MLRQTRRAAQGRENGDHCQRVEKLRQNVTSKLCAESRWRVTTPAMLHNSVTRIINKTARAWVSELFGMIYGCWFMR